MKVSIWWKKVWREEDSFQIFPFIQLKTILLLKEDLEAFYDFLCYILKYCMYELIAISKNPKAISKTIFHSISYLLSWRIMQISPELCLIMNLKSIKCCTIINTIRIQSSSSCSFSNSHQNFMISISTCISQIPQSD